jgi:hypothetical protein
VELQGLLVGAHLHGVDAVAHHGKVPMGVLLVQVDVGTLLCDNVAKEKWQQEK